MSIPLKSLFQHLLERVFRVSWDPRFALTVALLSAACGQSQPGGDQTPAADFYRGKTLSIIVGSGAGGGFDTTVRLVSRHISRHIPGELRVSAQRVK